MKPSLFLSHIAILVGLNFHIVLALKLPIIKKGRPCRSHVSIGRGRFILLASDGTTFLTENSTVAPAKHRAPFVAPSPSIATMKATTAKQVNRGKNLIDGSGDMLVRQVLLEEELISEACRTEAQVMSPSGPFGERGLAQLTRLELARLDALYAKCTVKTLRALLRERQLTIGGRKAELTARLLAHRKDKLDEERASVTVVAEQSSGAVSPENLETRTSMARTEDRSVVFEDGSMSSPFFLAGSLLADTMSFCVSSAQMGAAAVFLALRGVAATAAGAVTAGNRSSTSLSLMLSSGSRPVATVAVQPSPPPHQSQALDPRFYALTRPRVAALGLSMDEEFIVVSTAPDTTLEKGTGGRTSKDGSTGARALQPLHAALYSFYLQRPKARSEHGIATGFSANELRDLCRRRGFQGPLSGMRKAELSEMLATSVVSEVWEAVASFS